MQGENDWAQILQADHSHIAVDSGDLQGKQEKKQMAIMAQFTLGGACRADLKSNLPGNASRQSVGWVCCICFRIKLFLGMLAKLSFYVQMPSTPE